MINTLSHSLSNLSQGFVKKKKETFQHKQLASSAPHTQDGNINAKIIHDWQEGSWFIFSSGWYSLQHLTSTSSPHRTHTRSKSTTILTIYTLWNPHTIYAIPETLTTTYTFKYHRSNFCTSCHCPNDECNCYSFLFDITLLDRRVCMSIEWVAQSQQIFMINRQ